MKNKNISIIHNGKFELSRIDYDAQTPKIKLILENGRTHIFVGLDIYECLGKLIKSLPEIKFLCKGAKINVRPSTMSSQMTSGIMAYEHNLGVRPTRNDVVNIFDFDDQDIVNDPQMQTDYFYRWVDSIK
jgi:hypothetical protein